MKILYVCTQANTKEVKKVIKMFIWSKWKTLTATWFLSSGKMLPAFGNEKVMWLDSKAVGIIYAENILIFLFLTITKLPFVKFNRESNPQSTSIFCFIVCNIPFSILNSPWSLAWELQSKNGPYFNYIHVTLRSGELFYRLSACAGQNFSP